MMQVLDDTSVWSDHFRHRDEQLVVLLQHGCVLMHPMVRGELACGCWQHRHQVLALLKNLPQVSEAMHDEALYCLEQHKIMSQGIGFITLHLIAATLLTGNALFWTRDRRLNALPRY